MPGPKMGPRPLDFDEEIIRQSPTFIKWQSLLPGEKLRYACREFTKEHGDDEERLMRRIMIARRNNIRDHEVLKRARKEQQQQHKDVVPSTTSVVTPPTPLSSNVVIKTEPIAAVTTTTSTMPKSAATTARRRRPAYTFSDQQVEAEMDVLAVEATRSYRAWQDLKEGSEFVYNQKYVKGQEGHDWLLKKNIWRRMRYRRDCKKLVELLKEATPGDAPASDALVAGAGVPGIATDLPSYHVTVKQEPVLNNDLGKSSFKRKRGRSQLDGHHETPRVHSYTEADAITTVAPEGSAVATEQVILDADTSMPTTADPLNVARPATIGGGTVVSADEVQRLLDSDATVQEAAEQAAAVAVEEAAAVESLVMHDATAVADDAAVTAAAAAAAAVVADQEAIEAAVAAAETFGKSQHAFSASSSTTLTAPSNSVVDHHHHHHAHPMDTAALDAAAKLAAATAMGPDEDSEAATAAAAAVAASAENLYAVAAGDLPPI